MVELADSERAALDFEAAWFRYPGIKEQAISARLDVAPDTYYQQLASR